MESWQNLAAAVGVLGAVDVASTVFVMESLTRRQDLMAGSMIEIIGKVSVLEADSHVSHVLRVCAERPDVCEEN